MPGFDGTGPQGRGPMTGGARGYCVSSRPFGTYYGGRRGFFGRGFGRGMGRGRGWRAWVPGWGGAQSEPLTRAQELEMLKSEQETLQAQLGEIQGQINALEKDTVQ